jgi:hypothetical protein
MFTEFLLALLDFKWLAVIGIPLGIIMLALGLKFARHINFQQKRVKVFGILYGLKNHEMLWVTTGLLRVLFVLTILAFGIKIKATDTFLTANTVFFIALFFLHTLLRPSAKRFFFGLLNCGAIYAALIVGNILYGFYSEVRSDWEILSVYVLLALFLFVYALYFYFKDIMELLQEKTT